MKVFLPTLSLAFKCTRRIQPAGFTNVLYPVNSAVIYNSRMRAQMYDECKDECSLSANYTYPRRQKALLIVLLALTLLQPSLMTTTHTVYPSASTCASLPLDLTLPAGAVSANETSPLLPSKHMPRRAIFAWLNSFFDDNSGLLLVAASQFFFSGMNVSVKWLNSSDEPVPTLEVCVCTKAS